MVCRKALVFVSTANKHTKKYGQSFSDLAGGLLRKRFSVTYVYIIIVLLHNLPYSTKQLTSASQTLHVISGATKKAVCLHQLLLCNIDHKRSRLGLATGRILPIYGLRSLR
jgi:hypothetical protein